MVPHVTESERLKDCRRLFIALQLKLPFISSHLLMPEYTEPSDHYRVQVPSSPQAFLHMAFPLPHSISLANLFLSEKVSKRCIL